MSPNLLFGEEGHWCPLDIGWMPDPLNAECEVIVPSRMFLAEDSADATPVTGNKDAFYADLNLRCYLPLHRDP